ncbi:MAG: MFS transporter [Candidatus Peregrinibacteria bacterium]|nr:MFS transporter [Candidatus Peregrinibacteria bacterium]
MCVYIGIFILRFGLRPFTLWKIEKIGLRKSVIFGALFYAGTYPILAQVDGFGFWLIAFIVYYALADILYWLPFHAYYSSIGDNDHRGKHIAVRESLCALGNGAAPMLGGVLIATFGFIAAAFTASAVAIVSTFFLRDLPEISSGKSLTWKSAFRDLDKRGFFLFAGDGFSYMLNTFLWYIIIFLLFTEFATVGVLIGLSIFVQGVLFLVLGHTFDHGNRQKMLLYMLILMVLATIGRVLFAVDFITIILFDFLMMLALTFYSQCFIPSIYNLSKRSHNRLWFSLFSEAGWDIGAIMALSVSLLFTLQSTFEIRYLIFLNLFGIFFVGGILKKYFHKSELSK